MTLLDRNIFENQENLHRFTVFLYKKIYSISNQLGLRAPTAYKALRFFQMLYMHQGYCKYDDLYTMCEPFPAPENEYVLLHESVTEFNMSHNYANLDPRVYVMACISLAAKTDECAVSVARLINLVFQNRPFQSWTVDQIDLDIAEHTLILALGLRFNVSLPYVYIQSCVEQFLGVLQGHTQYVDTQTQQKQQGDKEGEDETRSKMDDVGMSVIMTSLLTTTTQPSPSSIEIPCPTTTTTVKSPSVSSVYNSDIVKSVISPLSPAFSVIKSPLRTNSNDSSVFDRQSKRSKSGSDHNDLIIKNEKINPNLISGKIPKNTSVTPKKDKDIDKKRKPSSKNRHESERLRNDAWNLIEDVTYVTTLHDNAWEIACVSVYLAYTAIVGHSIEIPSFMRLCTLILSQASRFLMKSLEMSTKDGIISTHAYMASISGISHICKYNSHNNENCNDNNDNNNKTNCIFTKNIYLRQKEQDQYLSICDMLAILSQHHSQCIKLFSSSTSQSNTSIK